MAGRRLSVRLFTVHALDDRGAHVGAMKGVLMRGRTAALAAASVITAGAVASAASAAAGPPPPPKGVGGAKVQQVAAGLHTPTSFAFGAGTLFEDDGGSETANPPNGGVFAIKNGTGTLIS